VGELRAAALGQVPIDERNQAEPVQVGPTSSSGPTSRRVPARGGSSRVKAAASWSSWPDA
jgi:hypothetical protein